MRLSAAAVAVTAPRVNPAASEETPVLRRGALLAAGDREHVQVGHRRLDRSRRGLEALRQHLLEDEQLRRARHGGATVRQDVPAPLVVPVVDDVGEEIEAPAARNRPEEVAHLDRATGVETGGFDPRPGADGGRLALEENAPHGRMGGEDRDEQCAVPAAHVHDGPGAREIVRGDHGGGTLGRRHRHRVVVERGDLGMRGHVLEGPRAEHGTECGLPRRHAVKEAAPGAVGAIPGQDGDRSERARHAVAQPGTRLRDGIPTSAQVRDEPQRRQRVEETVERSCIQAERLGQVLGGSWPGREEICHAEACGQVEHLGRLIPRNEGPQGSNLGRRWLRAHVTSHPDCLDEGAHPWTGAPRPARRLPGPGAPDRGGDVAPGRHQPSKSFVDSEDSRETPASLPVGGSEIRAGDGRAGVRGNRFATFRHGTASAVRATGYGEVARRDPNTGAQPTIRITAPAVPAVPRIASNAQITRRRRASSSVTYSRWPMNRPSSANGTAAAMSFQPRPANSPVLAAQARP